MKQLCLILTLTWNNYFFNARDKCKYGDSDSVVADEAQSTCNENKAFFFYMVAGEKTVRENEELKRRKCCRVCGEK